MIAKKLEWEKVKHECFEDFAYKAFISVLKLNGNPAYYQVSKVNDNIQGSFWCHNTAFCICNYSDINTAKNECQKHYERLVYENCSPIAQQRLSEIKTSD